MSQLRSSSSPTSSLRARALRRLLGLGLRLPTGWQQRAAGAPPVNDRGSTLDPGAHTMAWLDGVVQRHASDPSPHQARARMRDNMAIISAPARQLEVEEINVAGRPARLYRPAATATPPPLLVWLHGGGWVVGDLDTHHPLCTRLAQELGALVVAVDYRLAPEHPFPAAHDDAVAALAWALDQARALGADPDRVVIGGDSAGGNLSAAACLAQRDAGGPQPALQVLVYPAVDARLLADSLHLFAEGFLLTTEDIRWYLNQYNPADVTDARVSPLLAADHAGLPPAIVVTAGFDPLRDEGEQYAAALAAAGVDVEHLDADDMVHGFVNMDGALPQADRWLTRLEGRVRDRLVGPT